MVVKTMHDIACSTFSMSTSALDDQAVSIASTDQSPFNQKQQYFGQLADQLP